MSPSSQQTSVDIIAAIAAQNAGRDPERLRLKVAKMALDPFVFLRGACHLFYDGLPDAHLFREAPLAWCCGDLHFENYGSYKADNRQVYFDINDYDEAALAPAPWDMLRLLTSLQCGADALKATPGESLAVCRSCVDAYRSALVAGKPLWLEREISSGLISELLEDLRRRPRADYLDKRTQKKGQRRSLSIGDKALPASPEDRQRVADFMARFAAAQDEPRFYQVIDIARRIAGTGSLGVTRFVVLVEGKGSPDGNYLLDIKEARPSALAPRLAQLGIAQPAWRDEAERVVAVQKRMQAVDHAFLHAVDLDGLPCILRGLQPSEDRVAIGAWGRKLDRLKDVATAMGRILAWDQLRASGRGGAATADALSDFAASGDWVEQALDASAAMAQMTNLQWKEFAAWMASHPGGEVGR